MSNTYIQIALILELYSYLNIAEPGFGSTACQPYPCHRHVTSAVGRIEKRPANCWQQQGVTKYISARGSRNGRIFF